MQNTEAWPIALASHRGHIDNHYPPNKLLDFANRHEFIFPIKTSHKPLPNALLVFTDGSSNGTAAYVVGNSVTRFHAQCSSAQLVELHAVIAVFATFPNQTLNIYTDSAYIAQSVPLLETVGHIKTASTASDLFRQLQTNSPKNTTIFYWTSKSTYWPPWSFIRR